MNNKCTLIAALCIALSLTSCTTHTHPHHVAALPQAPTTSTTIMEDSPLWDCTTMGNRECGPMPTPDSNGLVCWSELVDVDPGVEGICGTPAQALASHVAYWGLPQ